MNKNLYEILGLSEEQVLYFLNASDENEQNEESIKMRDEIVRNAYEKRKVEIEDKYVKETEKANEENNHRIEIINLTDKFSKPSDVNIKRKEDSLANNKLEFNKIIETINKKHEIDVQSLEYAYEKLETEQSRQEYNKYLEFQTHEKEMEDISKNVERQYRIKKCDKHDQYNPDLLETIHNGELVGEKVVVRKPTKEPITVALKDERNIRIKQTGTVHYRNVTSAYNSYVNEYEITRNVDGEERTDIVYTEISLLRLGTKRKKDELVDPNYYDCVVNKLLSEDAIEGSKFNGGYVGLIEQMKNGQYGTTIDKDGPLSVEEQENLAAVMVLKEREEGQNGNKKEQEGEDR